MSNEITIYLIRHGETAQNKRPHLIGQEPNEPLSKVGKYQAKYLGLYFALNKIHFDRIYCSSYDRAVQTAKIACKQFTDKPPIRVSELREYDSGDMKGMERSVAMTPDTVQSMSTLGMLFKFPNGESLYEVQQRAVNWMENWILNNPNMQGKKIALFSHGMTIRCILQYIMEFNQKLTWRLNIDNTSVSVVRYKDGLWFVDSINDTSHFEAMYMADLQ